MRADVFTYFIKVLNFEKLYFPRLSTFGLLSNCLQLLFLYRHYVIYADCEHQKRKSQQFVAQRLLEIVGGGKQTQSCKAHSKIHSFAAALQDTYTYVCTFDSQRRLHLSGSVNATR